MPLAHDSTFRRVMVDYLISGTTRVTWDIQPHFTDAGPYVFTLQVNPNEGEPDQWVNVGSAVTNMYMAYDGTQRLFGKDRELVYRVQLQTASGTYISPNAQVYGNLSERQWNLARAIIRRLNLSVSRTSLPTFQGWLFKQKLWGAPCTCIDPFTGDCTDSQHPLCYGTGVLGGYWDAVPHTMYQFKSGKRDPHIDGEFATVDEQTTSGLFIGLPTMGHHDVFITQNGDARYVVHAITPEAEMNQVPIVVSAELKLAPIKDTAIYSLVTPDVF